MKSLKAKTISRYLLIKEYLLQGKKYKDLKNDYIEELDKLKTFDEKQKEIELKKLYKIYYHYFKDCSSIDDLKKPKKDMIQKEKLF